MTGKPRITNAAIAAFRRDVYRHYTDHGRDLPWRKEIDPYRVFVSEVMLQQTQVDRVAEKYGPFFERFPTLTHLARATPRALFAAWQGLGYNRRALALQRAAAMIIAQFGGSLPDDVEALDSLPGIGPATARSIAAFAFNKPTVFIETNIRSVFIHRFFAGRSGVTDDELLPYVAATLDRTAPGRWYNALMDYGVALKKRHGNPSRQSAHYNRQSKFEGSDRQIRGKVVGFLVKRGCATRGALAKALHIDEPRLGLIIDGLAKEGVVRRRGRLFSL